MRLVRTALLVTTLPLAFGGTSAMAQGGSFIGVGTPMAAPRGFVEMCRRTSGPICGNSTMAQSFSVASVSDDDRTVPADATSAIMAQSVALDTTPTCTDVPTRLPIVDMRPVTAVSPSYASLFGTDKLNITLTINLPETAFSSGALSLNWQPRTQTACATLPAATPRPAASPPMARTTRPMMTDARPAVPALQREQGQRGKLSQATLRVVQDANSFVNRRVIQRTDLQIYGRVEVWQRSGTQRGAQGDCEDIAIEKRFELIDRGFPEDRLFFAVVYRRDIGLHTILIARLDSGDYALDNRTRQVVPWEDVPYTWVSIQNAGSPAQWSSPGQALAMLPKRVSAS